MVNSNHHSHSLASKILLGTGAALALVFAGVFLMQRLPDSNDSLLAESSGVFSQSQWVRVEFQNDGGVSLRGLTAKEKVLDPTACVDKAYLNRYFSGSSYKYYQSLTTRAAQERTRLLLAIKNQYVADLRGSIATIQDRIQLVQDSIKDVSALTGYYGVEFPSIFIAPVGTTPVASYEGGTPIYKCIQSTDANGVVSKEPEVLLASYDKKYYSGTKFEPNPSDQVKTLNDSFQTLLKKKAEGATAFSLLPFFMSTLLTNRSNYFFVTDRAVKKMYPNRAWGNLVYPQPVAGVTAGAALQLTVNFTEYAKNDCGTVPGWVSTPVKLATGFNISQLFGGMSMWISRPQPNGESVIYDDLCFIDLPTFKSMILDDSNQKLVTFKKMKTLLETTLAGVLAKEK